MVKIYGTPPAQAGFWIVEQDYTVPANATTVTFTGLDLDTHLWYKIYLWIENAGAGTCVLRMYYNNDAVNANYVYAYDQVDRTPAHNIAGAADAIIGFIDAASGTNIELLLKRTATDGRTRAFMREIYGRPAQVYIKHGGHRWDTNANVTRIDFTAAAALHIGQNSRIIILRPNL